MPWSEAKDIHSTGRLGIDWRELAQAEIDPRLIWADATLWQGMAPLPPRLRVISAPNPSQVVVDSRSLADAVAGLQSGLPQQWGLPLNVGREQALEGAMAHRAPPARINRPVLAIIDDGIALAHGAFRAKKNSSWQSRLRYVWDQGVEAAPGDRWWREVQAWDGNGHFIETLYGREMRNHGVVDSTCQPHDALDQWLNHLGPGGGRLDEAACYRAAGLEERLRQRVTHGTHVLGLLAGDGGGARQDAAARADLIAVQLPRATVEDTAGLSMATHVMDALQYIFDRVAATQPVVVNLSFGSMAGPHSGNTLLERGMDQLIQARRQGGGITELVLPAGNGRKARCHAVLTPKAMGPQLVSLGWRVMHDDHTDSFLELWYPAVWQETPVALQVSLVAPDGRRVIDQVGPGQQQVAAAQGLVSAAIVHRAKALMEPTHRQVLIALRPTAGPRGWPALAGDWQIQVAWPDGTPSCQVQAWVERDDSPLGSRRRTRQSRLFPIGDGALLTEAQTGNSLAHGQAVIVVGATRSRGRWADYSGFFDVPQAGPPSRPQAAVQVEGPDPQRPGRRSIGTYTGDHARLSGTSMAAPLFARDLFNCLVDPTNGAATPAAAASCRATLVSRHTPPAPSP
jgi:subtilisin family serine protease